MNKKKIWKYGLSFLLMLVLVVGIIPTSALQTEAETAGVEGKEAVRYVSATGDDTNTGLSYDKPFSTLTKAIQELCKVTGVEKRTIRIVGAYEWKRADDDVAHGTYEITITGVDRDAVFIGESRTSPNLYHKGGNIRFEHIRLRLQTVDNLLMLGLGWTIGEGVTIESDDQGTASYPTIVTGEYYTTPLVGTNKQCLEVSSGSFGNVYLGNHYWQTVDTKNSAVSGVEFVLNGGTITAVKIGGSTEPSGNATEKTVNHYTGNVNVVINGGEITEDIQVLDPKLEGSTTEYVSFALGTAVQVILNHLSLDDNGAVVVPEFGADALKTDVEAHNGQLYVLQCVQQTELTYLEGESSRLEPTDAAGVFEVVGNLRAVATNEDGKEFESDEDGKLDLRTAAGTYTVTWEAREVYVSQGATNGDGTLAKPYGSLQAAMRYFASLGTVHGVKRINVIGQYVMDTNGDRNDYATHAEMYVIRGVDTQGKVVELTPNTELVPEGKVEPTLVFSHTSWIQGGPLAIENIVFKYAYGEVDTFDDPGTIGLYALQNQLLLGEQVIVRSNSSEVLFAKDYQSIVGLANHWNSQTLGGTSNATRFTMNTGNFYKLYLGHNYLQPGGVEIPGAYFEMNGGNLIQLSIGPGNGSGKQTYTNGVKLMINGGSIVGGGIMLDTAPETGEGANARTEFDNKAVEIIANYDTEPQFHRSLTKDAVQARNGEYYVLFCEKVLDETGKLIEECRLDFTETPGVYEVPEGWIAIAINDEDITDARRSNPMDNRLYLSDDTSLVQGLDPQGSYHVFFFEDNCEYWIAGGVLEAKEDCTLDLTLEKMVPYWEDRIFLGWNNLTTVKSGYASMTQDKLSAEYKACELKQGERLMAEYLEYDEQVEFASEGAQIKRMLKKDVAYTGLTDTEQTLRFRVRMNPNLPSKLEEAVQAARDLHKGDGGLSGVSIMKYGMFAPIDTSDHTVYNQFKLQNFPSCFAEADSMKSLDECTVVKTSEVENTFKDNSETLPINRYVLEYSGLKENDTLNRAKTYATRAYIKYLDIHGMERAVYTEQINKSMKQIANHIRSSMDLTTSEEKYFMDLHY
ncbi:MAG: hypothetical protein UHS49_06980 [Faecalimonas sp.]|nr:hypothetical protein [Faecalimonas sp.]